MVLESFGGFLFGRWPWIAGGGAVGATWGWLGPRYLGYPLYLGVSIGILVGLLIGVYLFAQRENRRHQQAMADLKRIQQEMQRIPPAPIAFPGRWPGLPN